MFGIIDENKKIILYNENSSDLRTVALLHLKETEDGLVPMFTEDNVDEAIHEYTEEDIETASNGEIYLKGYAPVPTHEEQSEKRAVAYLAEVDPLHARKMRKTILGEWTEDDEEEYLAKVKELSEEIEQRYPYSVGE